MEKIGCDFDGTLVDYGFKSGEPVKANHKLLEQLRGKAITISTNQGGLGFGLMNATRPGETRKYPTPQDFYDRFTAFLEVAKTYDITVDGLWVSLHHPRLEESTVDAVRDKLRAIYTLEVDLRLFVTGAFRKPSPRMLESAKITVYFGDSDEDRQAAEAAGVGFRQVVRYMG